MKPTFNPHFFLQQMGKDLVSAFDRADLNTTPGQVGAAKEKSVRQRLEQILPVGIAVGSGCVIDSYGGTSRQMDIVLFEKDICPTYCIANTPDATYYPCESVIAVGEIKSAIGTTELDDIFSKIRSVKSLRRFTQAEPSVVVKDTYFPFRSYGSRTAVEGTKEEDYCQDANPHDQIFVFALARSFRLNMDTFCKHFLTRLRRTESKLAPNLIVTLEGGLLCPVSINPGSKPRITSSFQEATGFVYHNSLDGNFQFLVSTLYKFYGQGRTVPVSALNRYFSPDGILTLPLDSYHQI